MAHRLTGVKWNSLQIVQVGPRHTPQGQVERSGQREEPVAVNSIVYDGVDQGPLRRHECFVDEMKGRGQIFGEHSVCVDECHDEEQQHRVDQNHQRVAQHIRQSGGRETDFDH